MMGLATLLAFLTVMSIVGVISQLIYWILYIIFKAYYIVIEKEKEES